MKPKRRIELDQLNSMELQEEKVTCLNNGNHEYTEVSALAGVSGMQQQSTELNLRTSRSNHSSYSYDSFKRHTYNNVITWKYMIVHQLRNLLTRDPVVVRWTCYCYIIIILLLSITMDLKSLVAKTSNFRETSVRRHHIFLCSCMSIAILLYIYQLVYIFRHNRHQKIKMKQKQRLIVPHIMVLLSILCVFSIVFYIWKIIQTVFRKRCLSDSLSFNTQTQQSTRLAEYFFDSLAIIYFTLQGLWLVITSYYRFSAIKIGVLFCLTLCQAFTTNASLYFDITVKEAAHTFQQVEMRHNATTIQCDTKGKSPWLEKFYAANLDYVEPLGYAGVIECLVLFVIILTTITHEVVRFSPARGGVAGAGSASKTPSIRRRPTKRATIDRTPVEQSAIEMQPFRERVQSISFDLEPKADMTNNHVLTPDSTQSVPCSAGPGRRRKSRAYSIAIPFSKLHQRPGRWTITWVAFSHSTGLILSLALVIMTLYLSVVFGNHTFGGNAVLNEDYCNFLTVRTTAFCLMNSLILLSMINQRRNKHRHATQSSHVKLDLRLLNISVLAPVTYSFFLLQSCTEENSISPMNLKTLQTVDSISNMVQVLLQVVFFKRAICYETGVSLKPKYNMPSRRDWLIETVTILLATVFNTIIWLFQLFTRKNLPMTDPTARDYYPPIFWAFMREFTYPLMIFFRFHSFAIGLNLLRSRLSGYRAAKAIGITWTEIILPPPMPVY